MLAVLWENKEFESRMKNKIMKKERISGAGQLSDSLFRASGAPGEARI